MNLSVALCTYNGESFIEDQLNSILHQMLPVNEIVVCDDGSSDNTVSLVQSISVQHPRVKWIIKKNQTRLGVTKNFEEALSLCCGDIVFLSDQDDIWDFEKTKIVIDYFNHHPAKHLVFSDAALVDENGSAITDKTLFDVCGFRELVDAWNTGLQFEIENVIQRVLGATIAVRKSFLHSCLPFYPEVNNYHDGQLAMQSVIDKCNGYVDRCLIKYRIHSNNVIGLGGNAEGRISRVITRPWSDLVEPRDVNTFFFLPCASPIRKRVQFFIKRKNRYAKIFGKTILAVSFIMYIKFYRRFWFRFYSSDLLYGVSERLRQHLIQGWCKR